MVGGESKAKKKKSSRCGICEENHRTSLYPLLHGPKPSAFYCGLAGNILGFFQIPYDAETKPPTKTATTALVRIVEGEASAELVKAELTRPSPVK